MLSPFWRLDFPANFQGWRVGGVNNPRSRRPHARRPPLPSRPLKIRSADFRIPRVIFWLLKCVKYPRLTLGVPGFKWFKNRIESQSAEKGTRRDATSFPLTTVFFSIWIWKLSSFWRWLRWRLLSNVSWLCGYTQIQLVYIYIRIQRSIIYTHTQAGRQTCR